MIVICPCCTTKFKAPEDILKQGDVVKCVVCKHAFVLSNLNCSLEFPETSALNNTLGDGNMHYGNKKYVRTFDYGIGSFIFVLILIITGMYAGRPIITDNVPASSVFYEKLDKVANYALSVGDIAKDTVNLDDILEVINNQDNNESTHGDDIYNQDNNESTDGDDIYNQDNNDAEDSAVSDEINPKTDEPNTEDAINSAEVNQQSSNQTNELYINKSGLPINKNEISITVKQ